MELQYKIVNNVIDIFTGFDINSGIEKAVEFDFRSRREIEEFQKEKFKLLASMACNSDFYKKLKGKDYSEFPVMTRENFVLNSARLQTYIHKPFKTVKSSGSTNTPVVHYVTKEMLLAKRISHQKMLNWYGLNRESPEFKVGGLPIDRKTKIYYYLKNKRYSSSFDVSENTLPAIVKEFNRFKPKVLLGYPSSIKNFLNFSKIKNYSLNPPEIVVTHAENLYKDVVDIIKKSFPSARIVNQYWSTEANIAEMCPHGNLHVDEDTVITELINKDKNGTGDLLITNLYSYSVPYIRYRIGDRVKFAEEPCKCGRQTKVIESFEGREIDFIELKDGKKLPVTAFYFGETENILSYQLIYQKKTQKLIFRYVPVNKNYDLDKKYISDLIMSKMALTADFEIVKEIKLTDGGKFKRLIIEN